MKNKKGYFELNIKNIVLALGIVLSTALSIIASLLLGEFLDFIVEKPSFDEETGIYLLVILVALLVSTGCNIILGQWLPLKLELRKSIEYSQDVMDGTLNTSQRNFQKHEKGYYINLVTNSAFTYGDIYGQMSIQLVGYVLCVVMMVAVAMYINVWFGLVYIIYIPLFAILVQSPSKRIASFQKEGLPTQDAFLSSAKKIVEDKRAINISRAEKYYSDLYKNRSSKYLAFVTKFRFYQTLSNNMPTLLSTLLTAAMLGIAALLYFGGQATVGTIFIIYQLSQLLQTPLNRCFEIIIYASVNTVHVDRINDFKKEQSEPSGFEEYYRAMDELATIPKGEVYASAEHQRKLFDVEDMVLPKNKLILIKGGNGTGKSTLTNLLTGFTDIAIFDGKMNLDKTLESASYLSHPILYADGDLKENMFGKKIDKEVMAMLGIDYEDKIIDESGSNLSFGEQQKLGLLRVLSSDAETIVLDEPLTNLDRKTIESLTNYIVKKKNERSFIAIMHSTELDEAADIIIEIKDEKLYVDDRTK